jgi:hypothetical protein
MAWIAAPLIDWGGDAPQQMTEPGSVELNLSTDPVILDEILTPAPLASSLGGIVGPVTTSHPIL